MSDRDTEFTLTFNTFGADRSLTTLEDHAIAVQQTLDNTRMDTIDTEAFARDTVDRVQQALTQTEKAVTRSETNAYFAMNRMMGAFHAVANVIGNALGPVEAALLNGVVAAVEGLMAIAAAQYSNPWTLAWAITTTAAAITLSITGALLVQNRMGEAAQQLQQAQSLLNTVNILR